MKTITETKTAPQFIPYNPAYYNPETVKPADQAIMQNIWEFAELESKGGTTEDRRNHKEYEVVTRLESPASHQNGVSAEIWLVGEYGRHFTPGTTKGITILTSNDFGKNKTSFELDKEPSGVYTLAKSVATRDGKPERTDYHDPVAEMALSGAAHGVKNEMNQRNIDELLTLEGNSNVPQAEAEDLLTFLKGLERFPAAYRVA